MDVDNAVGLGCEAKSKEGWLELLCRKKNGTGGHPTRAIRDLEAFKAAELAGAAPGSDAGAAAAGSPDASAATAEAVDAGAGATDAGTADPRLANVVMPDEQGELRVIVPWPPAQETKIRIEWSDTKYDFVLADETANLVLPVTLGIRRKCEGLRKASEAVVAAGKKLEGEAALTSADTAKLPRFGVCQMAGLGAWAVTLGELTASGAGAARSLAAKLDVVHLDAEGVEIRAPFGTLEFAPGSLQMPPLMVYDYDNDGEHEVIVRHEITKVPAGKTPAPLPAVYSFIGGAVAAYAKLGPMGPGGVSVDQLEFDMRPDLADYGPYVAWLGDDCGARTCPGRMVGPRFFAHSTPDGGFSRTDASATGALKRACSQAPTSIVVSDGKSANVARTATSLGCAKAWGVDAETITKELTEKRSVLCGSETDCPLFVALRSWAAQDPPARVSK